MASTNGKGRRVNIGDGSKQRAKADANDKRKGNGKTKEQLAAANSKRAEKGISKMMEDFVANYIQTWDAGKAALAAGYSATSAPQRGCQLLKEPRVKALLEAERERIRGDHRKTHEALAAYYLEVLSVDAVEIMSQIEEAVARGEAIPRSVGKLIESVKVREVVSGSVINDRGKVEAIMGKQIEFKLFSKPTAADMLNKHVGFYEVDNKQKVPDGVSIYIPDNGRNDSTALPTETEPDV